MKKFPGAGLYFRNGSRAVAVAMIAAAALVLICVAAPSAAKIVAQERSTGGKAEPWDASAVVQPEELAKELTGDQSRKPAVVCVGFKFLYDSAHIPGAILLGPARDAEGLKSLESAAARWPRNRDVVIYCGCCPLKECPNARPAFAALKRMGFTRLRLLDIPQNFGQDWVRKGLPMEKSAPPPGN